MENIGKTWQNMFKQGKTLQKNGKHCKQGKIRYNIAKTRQNKVYHCKKWQHMENIAKQGKTRKILQNKVKHCKIWQNMEKHCKTRQKIVTGQASERTGGLPAYIAKETLVILNE